MDKIDRRKWTHMRHCRESILPGVLDGLLGLWVGGTSSSFLKWISDEYKIKKETRGFPAQTVHNFPKGKEDVLEKGLKHFLSL